MSDPREFSEQASSPSDGSEQIEQIGELDARVENDDQVKGGAKRREDPDQGGEVFRP